jgi:hypothetical protein
LTAIGHAVERIRAEAKYLLEAGCITAEHQRTDTLGDADLVTLAAPGAVHLEMIDSVYYLAACAEDTWSSDQAFVSRVCDRIGKTRLAHLSEATVLENVGYLESAADRWPVESDAFTNTSSLRELHNFEHARTGIEVAERQLRERAKHGRVYVGNMPYAATSEELADIFIRAGLPVLDVAIPSAPDGSPKGFAFVSVGTPEAVAAAIRKVNGTLLHGRTLAVSVATERKGFGSKMRKESAM